MVTGHLKKRMLNLPPLPELELQHRRETWEFRKFQGQGNHCRQEIAGPAWVGSFREDCGIDVSVCIANWNCRELLRQCLESLNDQLQGVRLEPIVVDNASSDGSADMVARKFPEVVLVRNPTNLGFARANNQAAQRARGRFLFFLNNDTVVPAGTLHRLVTFADANPGMGIIGPRLRDGRGRLQVSYRPRLTIGALFHRTSILRGTGLLRAIYRRCRRQDFDPHTTRPAEVLMGAALLIPREVFFTCGRWDEDFTFGGEDLECTRRNIGFASIQIARGFIQYLRKTGCSGPALLAYKGMVTLALPVQLWEKGLQYLWRQVQGRRGKAQKSLLVVKGLWHILFHGLGPIWKA